MQSDITRCPNSPLFGPGRQVRPADRPAASTTVSTPIAAMGQSTSSAVTTAAESRSQHDIISLFQKRTSQLFTATELAAIHKRLPQEAIDRGHISPLELASFLGVSDLSTLADSLVATDGAEVSRSLEIFMRVFSQMGRLPILDAMSEEPPISDPCNDKEAKQNPSQSDIQKSAASSKETKDTPVSDSSDSGPVNENLSIQGLVVAIAAHQHRLTRIWKNFDYEGLLFWAISEEKQVATKKETTEKEVWKREPPYYTVHVLQDAAPPEQTLGSTARCIDWNTLETLPDLTVELPPVLASRHVHAEDLRSLFSLMLVVNVLPSNSQCFELAKMTSSQWRAFDAAANSLVKHYAASSHISFPHFRRGMRLTSQFRNTFRSLIQKQVFCEAPKIPSSPAFGASPAFNASRLVSAATVAQLAIMLGSDIVSTNVAVTTDNLIELYNGSKSGFSMRSLESKIFKWHAPTIFFVAGKRVKSHNKRYEAFDAEFPRLFRSDEPHLKPGQNKTDRLVYAVYVSSPWQVSNKANFGNADSVIMALQPRANAFSAIGTPVHSAKSVYFNTQGMGIGFGNEQPTNKNRVRRYHPGNVSLTIEANLEFAVFRHISHAAASSPNFFRASPGLSESLGEAVVDDFHPPADYEDRFIITDLEVWGLGSTKELNEQKKNWEWEEKQAQARQSVNVRNMGEDRAFMEMVGLVGNHGSGGSV